MDAVVLVEMRVSGRSTADIRNAVAQSFRDRVGLHYGGRGYEDSYKLNGAQILMVVPDATTGVPDDAA